MCIYWQSTNWKRMHAHTHTHTAATIIILYTENIQIQQSHWRLKTVKHSKRSRTFDEFPFINHLSDMKTRNTPYAKCSKKRIIKKEQQHQPSLDVKIMATQWQWLSLILAAYIVICSLCVHKRVWAETFSLQTNVHYELNKGKTLAWHQHEIR